LMAMYHAREMGDPFALVLLDCHMPEMDGFTLAAEIKRRPGLASTTIIMLTSAGQTSDGVRCRELGVAACLTKPVRQSELLNAIILTLNKALTVATRPARTVHPAAERNKGLRILLAEDNAVNQRLAIRLLEKQGHTVVVANNGREAVSAFERERFNLILMDVQMPEMSGFEATAAIREREQATGAHLPIIAMTAHAMTGDRERCLEAGMDSYISKPIQANELFKLIAELAPMAKEMAASAQSNENSAEVLNASDTNLVV